MSALLLQLVQTSAHDVCVEARRIEKARQHAVALRRQESFSESQSQGRRVQPEESFLDEHDQEVCHLPLSSAGMTLNYCAGTPIICVRIGQCDQSRKGYCTVPDTKVRQKQNSKEYE